jgi:hypothetical protein
MFHVERLDGFAAYLPRVPGFVCGQSVQHLIGDKGDSRLSSQQFQLEPSGDFFRVALGLQNPGGHLQSNCEQALGPDLQLPFRRWFYGLRALLNRIQGEATQFGGNVPRGT